MTYTPVPPARWIEPELVEYSDFPDSTLTTEPMLVLQADRTPVQPSATLGVPYAAKSGLTLHLQLLLPPGASPWTTDTYPLVVFVQGSAWREQSLGATLPAMADVATRGYVVAIVEYRPSTVAPFPAQVRDVRTHIGDGIELPPFLVMHGSKDRLVPFGQSIMLVEALRAAGQDVTFYRVAGADHGDPSFWKPATLDLVVDFIESHQPRG